MGTDTRVTIIPYETEESVLSKTEAVLVQKTKAILK